MMLYWAIYNFWPMCVVLFQNTYLDTYVCVDEDYVINNWLSLAENEKHQYMIFVQKSSLFLPDLWNLNW